MCLIGCILPACRYRLRFHRGQGRMISRFCRGGLKEVERVIFFLPEFLCPVVFSGHILFTVVLSSLLLVQTNQPHQNLLSLSGQELSGYFRRDLRDQTLQKSLERRVVALFCLHTSSSQFGCPVCQGAF